MLGEVIVDLVFHCAGILQSLHYSTGSNASDLKGEAICTAAIGARLPWTVVGRFLANLLLEAGGTDGVTAPPSNRGVKIVIKHTRTDTASDRELYSQRFPDTEPS